MEISLNDLLAWAAPAAPGATSHDAVLAAAVAAESLLRRIEAAEEVSRTELDAVQAQWDRARTVETPRVAPVEASPAPAPSATTRAVAKKAKAAPVPKTPQERAARWLAKRQLSVTITKLRSFQKGTAVRLALKPSRQRK